MIVGGAPKVKNIHVVEESRAGSRHVVGDHLQGRVVRIKSEGVISGNWLKTIQIRRNIAKYCCVQLRLNDLGVKFKSTERSS